MYGHRELINLIDQYSQEGETPTSIPGVSLYKTIYQGETMPIVYNPCLCFIAQGAKRTVLEDDVYQYGALEYLVATVDLPIKGTVIEASTEKPYLLVKINIDQNLLSELLVDGPADLKCTAPPRRGLFIDQADEQLVESVVRLVRLLNAPKDIPVLALQMVREIYYRILSKNSGRAFAQIALQGSHMQNIAMAIKKIKTCFHESISIQELTALAGMSTSTFHQHFKSITAMSPLQFQKKLRLVEARSLLVSNDMDVASVAYKVGYESPSQFSREYSRLFGSPPARDIEQLQQIKNLPTEKR